MKTKYPPGWDKKRVQKVLEQYESQSEEEALAEDEAACEQDGQTTIDIPSELVPMVRELIAKHVKSAHLVHQETGHSRDMHSPWIESRYPGQIEGVDQSRFVEAGKLLPQRLFCRQCSASGFEP